MMLRFIIIFIIGLFLCGSQAIAKIGTCEAHAEAFIGVLEFDIKSCEVKGKLVEADGKLSGEFSVELASLDTGLDLRNQHMREKYLNTDKFPQAKFLLDPFKIGDKNFTGMMTLHGVSKKINGKVLASTKNSIKAEFDLDLTEFAIDIPEYKGITIAKHIRVFVSIP